MRALRQDLYGHSRLELPRQTQRLPTQGSCPLPDRLSGCIPLRLTLLRNFGRRRSCARPPSSRAKRPIRRAGGGGARRSYQCLSTSLVGELTTGSELADSHPRPLPPPAHSLDPLHQSQALAPEHHLLPGHGELHVQHLDHVHPGSLDAHAPQQGHMPLGEMQLSGPPIAPVPAPNAKVHPSRSLALY